MRSRAHRAGAGEGPGVHEGVAGVDEGLHHRDGPQEVIPGPVRRGHRRRDHAEGGRIEHEVHQPAARHDEHRPPKLRDEVQHLGAHDAAEAGAREVELVRVDVVHAGPVDVPAGPRRLQHLHPVPGRGPEVVAQLQRVQRGRDQGEPEQ
ncbi:MAG: hypothetical protein ACK56F_09870, partial [bacterium]